MGGWSPMKRCRTRRGRSAAARRRAEKMVAVVKLRLREAGAVAEQQQPQQQGPGLGPDAGSRSASGSSRFSGSCPAPSPSRRGASAASGHPHGHAEHTRNDPVCARGDAREHRPTPAKLCSVTPTRRAAGAPGRPAGTAPAPARPDEGYVRPPAELAKAAMQCAQQVHAAAPRLGRAFARGRHQCWAPAGVQGYTGLAGA